MTDTRKLIAAAISDPGATEDYKGDRSLTEWQTDAVMRALSRPIDPKAEVEPVAWMPIATAPKDGTAIIGRTTQEEVFACNWFFDDEDEKNGSWLVYGTDEVRPREWLPMPGSASPSIVAPVAVPDGWQLVPMKPTQEMLDAVTAADQHEPFSDETMRGIFVDMLAAAPALTPAEKAGVGDGLTGEQKEVILLHIMSEMGGETDSSESKWSWLNWFCKDEVHGKHSDTFNRCHEKGWLVTSHNTSFDTSTTSLSAAGKEFVADTAMTEAFVDWWNAAPSRALSTTKPAQGDGELAAERLRQLYAEQHAILGEMLLDKSEEGQAKANWQGGKVNGIAAARSAIAAQGDDAQEEKANSEAARIADAVLAWMVKYDLLDGGNEYRAEDVISVMNDLAPAEKDGTR